MGDLKQLNFFNFIKGDLQNNMDVLSGTKGTMFSGSPTSLLEIVIKMCQTIDELIKGYNTLDEIIEKINNLYKEVDEKVREYVLSKIQEYIDSGELAKLVNVELFKSIVKDAPMLPLRIERKHRFMRENNHFSSSRTYSFVQGFCMIDENTMLCSAMPENISGGYTEGRLDKINVTTGEILSSTIVDGVTHCNQLSVDRKRKKLYIAPAVDRTGSNKVNYYLVFDLDSLTLLETVDLGFAVDNMCFDDTTDTILIRSGYTFYIKDINGTTLGTHTITYNDNTTGCQVAVKRGNFIYTVSNSPNVINVYDITKRKRVKSWGLPYYSNGAFFVGEVEGISFINDTQGYIMSCTWLNKWKQRTNIQMYKFDLNQGIQDESIWQKPVNTVMCDYSNVYVDCNSTVTNPNGSKSKPFKYLQEAFEMCKDNGAQSVNVYVLSPGNYQGIFVNGVNNLNITNDSGGDCYIEGIEFERCNNIDLKGFIIKGNKKQDPATSPIRIARSKITFKDCTINADRFDYGIMLYHSDFYSDTRLDFEGTVGKYLINASEGSYITIVKWGNNTPARFALIRNGSVLNYTKRNDGSSWVDVSTGGTVNATQKCGYSDGACTYSGSVSLDKDIDYTQFNMVNITCLANGYARSYQIRLVDGRSYQLDATNVSDGSDGFSINELVVQYNENAKKFTILANRRIYFNGAIVKEEYNENTSTKTNFLGITNITFYKA